MEALLILIFALILLLGAIAVGASVGRLVAIAVGSVLGRLSQVVRFRGFGSAKPSDRAPSSPSLTIEPQTLSARLHELESRFAAFGLNAAHPSALSTHPEFQEASRCLAAPDVSLDVVLQYVEGANGGLACAALAALRQRSDRSRAIERVQTHCGNFSAWPMYFALDFLAEDEPRVPVGAPLVGAKEWWADNPFMPLIVRDYFARRTELGDTATFGPALRSPLASSFDTIRKFLQRITHPFAATLIAELDVTQPPAEPSGVLTSTGRFWSHEHAREILITPDAWQKILATAERMLQQAPPRSLLITGEPLVGKTSLLRLLAERVEPAGWSIFEAGGADLMAGQIYIGQLEGRIRSFIDELSAARRLIWYIPDIVQLAGSGRHQGQSASMLEQILPAISPGRLLIWCEATPASTARLLQYKPALRSIFEIVDLEPLSVPATQSLARSLVDALAEKAQICFRPEAAAVAVNTARQYLGSSGLPGSALLVIKLTAIRAETGNAIEPRQVLETVSKLTGLPIAILDTSGRLDLQSIRNFFRARVIGQDEAVDTLVERIAMLKAGLNDPGRPIGVFLFAGPTGTGKTELAKAVATFLFGSNERLVRLDMSELQTPESISKILGNVAAPPESESIISRVREQPFSVLLLDEFEKSHPMIWDLFLQAFDEGRLTDAMGRVADLRHCLIILTTNLGATDHRSLGLGFAPPEESFSAEQVMRAISQTYRPEFQNRLDKVIVFRPLTRDVMRGILKKELSELLDRRGLKDRDWAIEWESSALEFLLEKGFSPEMGARPLKRAIDQYLIAPLSAIIVEKRFPEGEQFVFVRSDGRAIQAEFVDPDKELAPADAVATELDAPTTSLATMMLAPAGTKAEFQALETDYAGIEQTLESTEWHDIKAKLSGEISAAGFWDRRDRFDTLARLALMDRVKAATETAMALRARLARGARPPRLYSPELIARLALQLHLIKQGIRDAFDGEPIEVVFTTEPVFDASAGRETTIEWCQKLASMYRAWGSKRHMRISEVHDVDQNPPLLLISGFGAHRVLSREAGLHVFQKSEGSNRVTARVRLAAAPLGNVPAAKGPNRILRALDDAPRENTIVRRYRQRPPLVRDINGKWRTGRIDLALGGDFDLLGADST